VSDPASATHWFALLNWVGTVLLNATVDTRLDKRRRALRDSQLSQAVAAKLEDGNVRAAF